MRSRSAVGFLSIAIILAAFCAVGAARQTGPDQQDEARPREAGQRGPGRPGGPGGGRGPGAGRPISVEGAMKGMDRSLRQLHRQIGDASKKEDNLRLIKDMQRACVEAKGLSLPRKVERNARDDAQKAAFAERYRKQLMTSLRVMLDIEQDIVDGKSDDAAKKLERIRKLRDDAHEELGVKED